MAADSIITQKIGPLSGGVWLAVIGVGLGLGYYLRNRASNGGVATVVSPTAGTGGVSGTGPGGWSATTAPDATAPTPPVTAPLWAVGALAWLLTHNYDAALSDSAIRKYLASQPLTAQEQAIMNAVLSGYGPPPEVLPPTGVDVSPIVPPASTPLPSPVGITQYASFVRDYVTGVIFGVSSSGNRTALSGTDWAAQTHKGSIYSINNPYSASKPTPPPVPKTNNRRYTVRSGDNLSSIAARYYGWSDWTKIYNANRNIIRNPNMIYQGQVLVIP